MVQGLCTGSRPDPAQSQGVGGSSISCGGEVWITAVTKYREIIQVLDQSAWRAPRSAQRCSPPSEKLSRGALPA